MSFNKEGHQFIDFKAIDEQYKEAKESGALDLEKVKARIEMLAKEYEERKEKRLQRAKDEESKLMNEKHSDIFTAEVERLSDEFHNAETIEQKKDIANEMTNFLSSLASTEYTKKHLLTVETSNN